MPYDVQQLLQMTNEQLDQLFSSSSAGDIPDGSAKGTAIIASGTRFSVDIAEFVSLECIVLDYSQTSLVAHWIRDEIRLIGPGFYLGRVYWASKPLIHFALQFQQS